MWHFLVLTALYLALVQGTTVLLTSGSGSAYTEPASLDHLVRTIVVPVGLGAVFTLAVTAYLGRWDDVFADRVPLRRWVIAIPPLVDVAAGVLAAIVVVVFVLRRRLAAPSGTPDPVR